MAGRRRDPEVDARIVRAARELLVQGGQDAVTVAAVARQAGVGRPTIYRRYPDTEALLMAVLHADLETLRTSATELELPLQPAPLLVTVATHLFEYYARDPAASRALLQASLFAQPPWQARFEQQAWGFLGWLAAQLGRCQRAGTLSEDADTGLLAQAFFGFYLPLVIAGTNGALTLDQQRAMLGAVLEQHLKGWT